MARNFYFSEKVRSEIDLYEELIVEAMQIYGQDVYYIPRSIINEASIITPHKWNDSLHNGLNDPRHGSYPQQPDKDVNN